MMRSNTTWFHFLQDEAAIDQLADLPCKGERWET